MKDINGLEIVAGCVNGKIVYAYSVKGGDCRILYASGGYDFAQIVHITSRPTDKPEPETMIAIEGKEFSASTIKAALKAHADWR